MSSNNAGDSDATDGQGQGRFTKVQNFRGLGLSLVLAGLGLAGCAPCADCRVEAVLGQDRRALADPALRAAAAQFLGDAAGPGRPGDAGPGSGTSSGLPRFRIDPDVLGPDSTTPYRLARNRQIALRLGHETALGRGLALDSGIRVGLGHSVYDLPQGMGVLSDPARIGFASLSVMPEVSLVRRIPLGALEGRLRLGGGWQVARSRTTVRSALLDVRHTGTTRRGTVWLGAGLADPARGMELTGEARVNQGGSPEFGAELRLRLDR